MIDVPLKVSIITVSQRQIDGTFEKYINSVWDSKESARDELKRIKANFEKNLESGWRARTPIGQIDDLSIQFLEGNHYECKAFYAIVDRDVQTSGYPVSSTKSG
jgi:hypothetical protein